MTTQHTPEPIEVTGRLLYRLREDPDSMRPRRINQFSASVQPDSRLMTDEAGEKLARELATAYNATYAAGINPEAIPALVEFAELVQKRRLGFDWAARAEAILTLAKEVA